MTQYKVAPPQRHSMTQIDNNLFKLLYKEDEIKPE